MDDKIIIGAANTKSELSFIENQISQNQPSKVGIGVPEDYDERQHLGIFYPFYNNVLSYLHDVDIIPLEKPELLNHYGAIEMAIAVRESVVRKEEMYRNLTSYTSVELDDLINEALVLQGNIQKLRGEYLGEIVVPPKGSFYEKSIPLIRKNRINAVLKSAPTLERLTELLTESNSSRTAYALEKIKEHEPEMVIISDDIARGLNEKLPEYTYMTFFES